MDDKLREIILGRYKEQNGFNKFCSALYKVILIMLLFSDIFSLLIKGLIAILLVINIARSILDTKIRKNIHTATVSEYSWSIGMSIIDSILFMILIAIMGFDLIGLIVAVMLAFMINFEVRVLLDFRKLAKERDLKQKGNPF